MRIERLEPSARVKGRVLAFFEDGSCLKITEQELLDFGLCAGLELDDQTLEELKGRAAGSRARADAAAIIGRRAMSLADLGYGPARWKEELRRHGIPRELWDEAMDQAGDNGERIRRFLDGKLRGREPDEQEKRRLCNALARRGYSWGEIRAAWDGRLEEEEW